MNINLITDASNVIQNIIHLLVKFMVKTAIMGLLKPQINVSVTALKMAQ